MQIEIDIWLSDWLSAIKCDKQRQQRQQSWYALHFLALISNKTEKIVCWYCGSCLNENEGKNWIKLEKSGSINIWLE